MVRTRFAPSPTGYLHIGGVRTALFNWLFARRHGGRFLLRIDDTDAERNIEEALAPILHGFRWLGIDWDEGPEVGGEYGPYRQSQRLARHQAAVRSLVESGVAYHDYASTEELQEERDLAQRESRRFLYSRRWAAETPGDRARFEKEGRQGVVRLRMPREGSCRFRDLVRGDVEFEWAKEQDHVVQRADGTCLYHMASAVDDHDMEISHVIRAEEHLSNTPRQIFIAQGLGYELPEYAHLPYVAEPGSKNKLSKRKLDKYLKNPDFAKLNEHGRAIAEAIGHEVAAETFNPVIVDFYERVGYLPEAIVNYLLLLGWALDDRTEMFRREEMIEHFSLERVNSAPASFDPQKLLSFQERYMRLRSIEEKVEGALPFLGAAGFSDPDRDVVTKIIKAAGDRIKVAGDILEYLAFFLPDDQLAYDEKAFDKWIRKPAAAQSLRALAKPDSYMVFVGPESLELKLASIAENLGISKVEVAQGLRVAITGKAVGFGLYEALQILGPEHCSARVDRALELVSPS